GQCCSYRVRRLRTSLTQSCPPIGSRWPLPLTRRSWLARSHTRPQPRLAARRPSTPAPKTRRGDAWRKHAKRTDLSGSAEQPTAGAVHRQRPTHRRSHMGTKEEYGYGSRFLRAEDLAGKTATVTIASVEDVEFDDRGLKPVLHFGKKRALVTNAT